MNYERASQIIFKEAKKAGYVIEERKSVSTDSIYYTLKSGKCSLLFRVSDHRTKTNVITLRIDHKNNDKIVENFIKNRIKDLKYRVVKTVLGI